MSSNTSEGVTVIGPQPGRQEQCLSTPADIAIFGGSAGGGKALAIDTPIPTPAGWSIMGRLGVGDLVFDDEGVPCRVVMGTDVMVDNLCFRVTFSDGEMIVADSDHLWVTMTEKERVKAYKRTDEYRARRRESRPRRGTGKRPYVAALNRAREYDLLDPPTGTVRTTQEILETLTVRGRNNHSVTLAGALQMPDSDLPIEPYLLGTWLGDGGTRDGVMSIHEAAIAQNLRACGAVLSAWNSDPNIYQVEGLRPALNKIGLLGKKRIPDLYLRASIKQRIALLQGLMDTDGWAGGNGQCEFTSTSKRLAHGMRELLVSLGIKATICTGRATLNGKDCGTKYRIKFVAPFPVFRLARKAARQKTDGFRPTTTNRYIVSVEPVDSVPVRCIAVDSPNRMYLAGQGMVPTHNTWSLLLEPTRHIGNPDFGAVIFRETYPQITEEGGMWDESGKIYPHLGGVPSIGRLAWQFPSGAVVRFRHMQHEKSKYDYKGAQIPLICWDQLEDFSRGQFLYLLSRNRSTCGVRPYVRATCNPNPDSWLVDFLSWWIHQDGPFDGYARLDRAGKLRWFARIRGELRWADTCQELLARYGKKTRPKSVTFIPSSVYDNRILLREDPGYLANLMALDPVEQERLLGDPKRGGNWKVRAEAGKVFNRTWFEIVDAVPAGGVECRFWDFAATEKELKGPEPAFTAGVSFRVVKGVYYVTDMIEEQLGPAGVDEIFVNTSRQDAACCQRTDTEYMVRWEEEGGSSGKRETYNMIKMLAGLNADGTRPTGDKLTRAKPLARQAKARNVKLLAGPWNERWLNHMHNQPDIKEKDIMDASAGAFNELTGGGRKLAGRSLR